MYTMKSRVVMLVFFLLLGVIGFSLSSSYVKEGFESVTQWKQTGTLPWDGPYSLPETKHHTDHLSSDFVIHSGDIDSGHQGHGWFIQLHQELS